MCLESSASFDVTLTVVAWRGVAQKARLTLRKRTRRMSWKHSCGPRRRRGTRSLKSVLAGPKPFSGTKL